MNGSEDKKPVQPAQPVAQPMQEKVLAAIKAGQVKMRPRWHFVLQTTLMAVGAILLLLTLVYLASFIIFSLRQTGEWFVPIFGSAGWHEFFRSLPWILILLVAVFLVLLEVLVRRYAFAYHQPLLSSALAIVLIVVFGGIIVAETPLHRQLLEYARQGRLPVAGAFYRQFGMPRLDNVHRGVVLQLLPHGFILQEMEGETSTVVIAPQTHLPFGGAFSAGEGVVVFGPDHGNVIQALGVQAVNDNTP